MGRANQTSEGKRCPKCSESSPVSATFCVNCGSTLPEENVEGSDIPLSLSSFSVDAGFRGRHNDLERFVPLAADALNRRARYVCLTGPSGIGKSEFVRQLKPFFSENGFQTAIIKGYPEYSHLTLYPINQLIANVCGIIHSTAPKQLDRRLSVLKTFGLKNSDIKNLTTLFPVTTALPESQPAPVAVRLRALMASVVHLIQKLSRHKPLFLVFDRIEWIDRFSRQLLFRFPEVLAKERIFLVFVGNTAAMSLHPGSNVSYIALESLGMRDTLQLSRDYASSNIASLKQSDDSPQLPMEIEEKLQDVTGGNPMQIRLLLDYLKESNYLEWVTKGWTVAQKMRGMPFPGSSREIMDARIDLLKPHIKELLSLIAVASSECSMLLLESQYPHKQFLREDLDSLVRMNLIRVIPERSEETIEFRNSFLQKYLFERMSHVGRQGYHPRLAIYLHQAGPRRRYMRTWLTAYHASFNPAQATQFAPSLEKSGDDFAARLHFYSAALCYQSVCQMRKHLVDTEKEHARVHEFRFAATLNKLAECYGALHDKDRSIKTLQLIVSMAEKLDAPYLQLETLLQLSELSMENGGNEAKACLDRANKLAEKMQEPFVDSLTLAGMGEWLRLQGRFGEAKAALKEGIEIAVDVESDVDPQMHWSPPLFYSLGLLYMDASKEEKALGALKEALDGAVSTGDAVLMLKCLEQLAILYRRMEQFENAHRAVASGQKYSRKIGDPMALANFAYHAGQIFTLEGNKEDARTAYRESMEISRELLWVPGMEKSRTALSLLGEV